MYLGESLHLTSWLRVIEVVLTCGWGRIGSTAYMGVIETTRDQAFLGPEIVGSRGKPPYSHLCSTQEMSRFSAGISTLSFPWRECRSGQKWFSWLQTSKKKHRNPADNVFLMLRQFGHYSWIPKFF